MRLCCVILGVPVLVGCGDTDRGQDRESSSESPSDPKTASDEKQKPGRVLKGDAKSLVEAVKRFQSGLKAKSKEKKVAALKAMLPTQADLEALCLLARNQIGKVARTLSRECWRNDSGRFYQSLIVGLASSTFCQQTI